MQLDNGIQRSQRNKRLPYGATLKGEIAGSLSDLHLFHVIRLIFVPLN